VLGEEPGAAEQVDEGGLAPVHHRHLATIDHDPPLEREFTTQDGLPSNEVYELLLDGDYLWIGSDRGLTRFLWNDPDRID